GGRSLDAAHAEDRTPPALIAAALIATLVGVPIAPIVAALLLNRRFRRRNPGKRPYRWGYYFSIESFLAGLGLGIVLESGLAGVAARGTVYAALAWFFAPRPHWASLPLTVPTLKPGAGVI